MAILKKKAITTQDTIKMKEIVLKLQEGLTVQDSSAQLMSFLVQDFLDYAQIKSGKFKKNIKPFNIRDAVNKVMSIQKEKAQASKIKFLSNFVNISERPSE